MRQWRRIAIFPSILFGLWIILGLVVGPQLLRIAHEGRGLHLLRDALAATSDVPFEFVLGQLYQITVNGAIAILVLTAFVYLLRHPGTAHRIVGEATPGDVGLLRVVVCAVLLASTLWEDLASTAAMPRELIRPMGIMQLLSVIPIGFDLFASSAPALTVFKWITAAALFAGMIGWKTRIAVPVAAVAYLILGGLLRQYAWFYHTGLVPWYLLVVLAIVPSYAGLSVDRFLRLRRGLDVIPDEPSIQFGWARYALWMTMALPYVMAGFSKLRNGGLDWWEAANFKFVLYQGALRPMHFDLDASLLLTSAPDWIFELMAITAVAGEIGYGLVLFSRRARWVLPAAMLVMHIGILFLQNILFFDLIILQAIYFNFRPLGRKIAEKLPEFAPGKLISKPEAALRPAGGSPALSISILCLLALVWVLRIEFYPITSMQMFSKKRTEPVQYELPLAHLRSGSVVPAPIEGCIGAMADSRYRRIVEMAFDPRREHLTKSFLEVCMSRWNEQAPLADQIRSIEVQLWRWNYLTEPDAPPYGRMIERRVYGPEAEPVMPASSDRATR